MMAVLSDDNRQVAMTVSWMPQPAGERVVKIHILQDHPEMPDHTSWELWVIPHGSDKPVSMGFVTLAREQVLKLKPEAAKVLETAAVIALSLEPEKGSPTGLPTGPVLFKGPCLTVST